MNPRPRTSPEGPWFLKMKWRDVLFLHWPVPAETIQPHLPDCLDVETFDGSAWLGIVPFRMSGVRPRFLPSVSFLSNFPEINIRTYVTDGDASGVWFHSLDTSSWLSVKVARWAYSLNYYHASMSVRQQNQRILYESHRSERESGRFDFEGWYELARSLDGEPNELQTFLTERYYLFSQDNAGQVYRGRVGHRPWDLREANYEVRELAVEGHPSPPDEQPESVLYSPGLSVWAWSPEPVGTS